MDKKIVIRPANLKDYSDIADIHITSWRTTYKEIMSERTLDELSHEEREDLWKAILADSLKGITRVKVFVAEDNNNVIGFVSGGNNRNGPFIYEAEIYTIYLLKKYQKKGIGIKLFKEIVLYLKNQGFKSMIVWTLERNKACSFFKKLKGDPREISVDTNESIKLVEIGFVWDDLSILI